MFGDACTLVFLQKLFLNVIRVRFRVRVTIRSSVQWVLYKKLRVCEYKIRHPAGLMMVPQK
jgi:hypothetical protein